MTITATNPAQDAAELHEELRMLAQTGRITSYWTRPVEETFVRMGLSTRIAPEVRLHLDWYGPIEIWRSPEHEVSDILFNGPANDPFFVVQRGAMTNTGVVVHPSWITWTQQQLLLRSNKRTADGQWSQPMMQGVADRLRYAITQEPLSRDGGTLAVRMLPERWRTLDDLVQANTITRDAADLLLAGLEAGATVLVAGATGSGKTTLTAGFTQELGKRHRLIFVEDGGELPRTLNSLHLEANSDMPGEFSRCIKLTLRQKPNYIIVGEVRSGEAMAMLQAAATGHPGIGTIHASDVQTALRNLERMAMLGLAAESGGGGQAAAAIARGLITSESVSLIVVHIGRAPNGRRSVLAVEEVLRQGGNAQSGDKFTCNPLFAYQPHPDRLERVGTVNSEWGRGRY